jgi:hypothetical protein
MDVELDAAEDCLEPPAGPHHGNTPWTPRGGTLLASPDTCVATLRSGLALARGEHSATPTHSDLLALSIDQCSLSHA